MNKFKDFIIENKGVIYTVLFTLLAILMVALVVILSFSEDSHQTNATSTSNTESETTNSQTTEYESESKTTEETTSETTTEEITSETTTEETTTKAPVVVNYPYLIKVNRAANCTTVYGKDENGKYTVPVKAITVSCGENIDDTPLGEYNTINSYEWRLLFGNVYGHYAYRIIGSTLFHSVPYYTASNDDLEWQEYNKLGSSASMGCVRMTVADAKWLMDNCPIGTTVVIYDDAENPGPLGKPETIKIPADSPYKGWDPTDPNVNNPWHKFSATITYPTTKTVSIEKGSSYAEFMSYFSAKDTCGNEINHRIKIDGDYSLDIAGVYSVKVHVTDAIGKYAEVNITLNVIEKETTTETESSSSETTTTTIETTTTDSSSGTTTTEATSSNSELSSDSSDNVLEGEETTSPMP